MEGIQFVQVACGGMHTVALSPAGEVRSQLLPVACPMRTIMPIPMMLCIIMALGVANAQADLLLNTCLGIIPIIACRSGRGA